MESLLGKPGGKSSEFEKFRKAFSHAKEYAGKNEIAKAKKLYMESRKIYVGLSNEEKKEVYDKLMELYNKVSGK